MSKKPAVKPVMKVVTANYRDRDSDMRWLVRDEGAPLDSVVECKSLKAKEVIFCQSSIDEYGFGCRIVALCKSVEILGDAMQKKKKGQVTLGFQRDHFCAIETAKAVGKCTTLNLNPDGSIYATLGKQG